MCVSKDRRGDARLRQQDFAVRQGSHVSLHLRPQRRQARARVADRTALRHQGPREPHVDEKHQVRDRRRHNWNHLLRCGGSHSAKRVHSYRCNGQQSCEINVRVQ